ncbi:MAG: hypothetical protein M0R80_09915 [Proteobacteria bacterium]|jgi:hypothetical protein|nr:hypothetical protein [Pseudomonadota bacterium]
MPYDENCPLCRSPIQADAWSRLILSNEKSSMECAKEFDISVEEVNEHIYKHSSGLDADGDPNTPEHLKNKLLRFSHICEIWMDEMIVSKELDPSKLDKVLKLMDVIEKQLVSRAQIAGIIKKDAPQIQITNVQNNIDNLTNVIMMKLCPECKKIAIAEMEGFVYGEQKLLA